MDRAQIGDVLALVNAGLNATSAAALFAGFYFVKQRSLRLHRRAMLTALTASALFLVSYVTRVAFTGTHEFSGEGTARVVYLVRRRRFRSHARLARWVFPIWAYVSVTGLGVYMLLYQVYGYR